MQLSSFLANHRNELLGLAQRIGLRVADVAKQAWLLIVVPILAAFFLKDGRAFGEVLLSFVHSRPQREFLEGVLGDLNQMLAQFIRAQLTLAAFSFIAYIAFMELARRSLRAGAGYGGRNDGVHSRGRTRWWLQS